MIPFDYGANTGVPMFDRLLQRLGATLNSLVQVVTNDTLVDVRFPAFNTDVIVRHGLGYPPVSFEIIDCDANVTVWRSQTPNLDPLNTIILRASAAPLTARIRFNGLKGPRPFTPTDLAALNYFGFPGTPGSVVFVGAGGSLAEDNAHLFWNDASDVLAIGTNNPDTGGDNSATRLHVQGSVGEAMGSPGLVRSIIENRDGTGAAVLLFVNDDGIVDPSLPYASGGAAVYYTGTAWTGLEGPNKLVLMAPNPGVVDAPAIILGITGHRKAILPWVGDASSELKVYNPDVASAGGHSAVIVDNNQPGVSGALVVSGHVPDPIDSPPYDTADSVYLAANGGPIFLMVDDVIRATVDQAGDVSIDALNAGGPVKADVTTGKLSVQAPATGGAATAGVVYTAAEQAMLQAVYDAARAFGLLT